MSSMTFNTVLFTCCVINAQQLFSLQETCDFEFSQRSSSANNSPPQNTQNEHSLRIATKHYKSIYQTTEICVPTVTDITAADAIECFRRSSLPTMKFQWALQLYPGQASTQYILQFNLHVH